MAPLPAAFACLPAPQQVSSADRPTNKLCCLPPKGRREAPKGGREGVHNKQADGWGGWVGAHGGLGFRVGGWAELSLSRLCVSLLAQLLLAISALEGFSVLGRGLGSL